MFAHLCEKNKIKHLKEMHITANHLNCKSWLKTKLYST